MEEPAIIIGQQVTKRIGFGVYYAIYVHERLDLKHTQGEAKFLEKAIRNNLPTFARSSRRRSRRRWGSHVVRLTGEQRRQLFLRQRIVHEWERAVDAGAEAGRLERDVTPAFLRRRLPALLRGLEAGRVKVSRGTCSTGDGPTATAAWSA